MSMVIPCIRGQLGDTQYYAATMPARELVTGVRPASELDTWASMSIEERMQREPNTKRIMTEIAPYIAKAKDRFFGSVIVLVYRGEIMFESLADLSAKIPGAYRAAAEGLGFITISGGSLIVLDGQHRLLALEQVIKNQVRGPYSEEVPNDEICVIFINHESTEKTRRIFNKVNRYAKPTSRGDNIITSEDDGYAIIARRLLDEDAPLGGQDSRGEEIVNWRSNTLGERSTKLTTISVVYETVKLILRGSRGVHFDDKERPSDTVLDDGFEIAQQFWATVLDGLTPYKMALADPSRIPEMREENAAASLLFKPVAQIALFAGLVTATTEDRLSLSEAVARANRIDWQLVSPIWRHVLIRPNDTIDPRAEARDHAAQLIAYLIAADEMTQEERDAVLAMYRKVRGNESETLPDPVVPVATGF